MSDAPAAKPPLPAARPKLTFKTLDEVIADVRQLRISGYRKAGTWSLPQIAWHVSFPIRRALSNPVPDRTTRTPEEAEAFRKFADYIAGRTVAQLTAPAVMQPASDLDDAEIDRLIELLEKLKAYKASHIGMGPFGPTLLDEFLAFQYGHIAHHLSHVTPIAKRRMGLSYASIDDAIADLHRLRDGYEQSGNWSLAQICWHLNATTKARLKPGPHPANTPEQDGRKEIFAKILATGRLPEGLIAPDVMQPPSDAERSAISQFIETLEQVKTHAGPFAPHRLFGNMSDADSRKQILIHSAHHLSHLTPIADKRREKLRFDNVNAIVTDVETLKKGHIKAGRWTLPQAAWHVGLALHYYLKPLPPGDNRPATPGKLIPPGSENQPMPPGLPIAPGTDPLKDAPGPIDDAEVDRLIAVLQKLDAFPHDRVEFGPFGVVTADEFRQFIRSHAANHFSNFIPTT